ncbi:hypothetical protein PIB30_005942 [Stylosanthes scabra]|uniref:Peptidase M48 domain-containing protein n=1 Tax=Stylosanthes scabra TaxID=79078 RepID=A0ABU6S588_9FABA|nr:hypothetical protein [Stylosanthes scabra]
MASTFYRKGKVALHCFRTLASKVQNFQGASRIFQSKAWNANRFASFPSIPPRLVTCLPRKPRHVFVVVGSGILITMYYGNLETVPYTKRTHSILLSKSLERQLGDVLFESFKADYKGKILPPQHPDSVRIRMIFKEITDASAHEGFNWEVLLVDKPDLNAVSRIGGKIVVFTGLLEHFKTDDAEIATIIGHEVAHVVARHDAETMTKYLWLVILHFTLHQFITYYINKILSLYEKLGKLERYSALDDLKYPHPSGKKRAELLSQAKIIEEALTIYNNNASSGTSM